MATFCWWCSGGRGKLLSPRRKAMDKRVMNFIKRKKLFGGVVGCMSNFSSDVGRLGSGVSPRAGGCVWLVVLSPGFSSPRQVGILSSKGTILALSGTNRHLITMSSTGSVKQQRKRSRTKGARLDPGWEHAIDVDNMQKKVKCKHCNKVFYGGIHIIKHRLAGTHINVESCALVPQNVKEQFRAILVANVEETEKRNKMLSDIGDNEEEEERLFAMERNRKGKGKIDQIFSKANRKVQTTINQLYKKDERDEFGAGFKPPSFHEVREKFLKKEVSGVRKLVEEHKKDWKKFGCSIMSDGWTDKRRHTLCNFLVNSVRGTIFLSSVDASDISKTANKIFEMLDDVVEKVGEDNVIQVVTDNAANYKAAGEKLMEKRTKLYWTPCAAHCIDLMLEDFDKKIKVHSLIIGKAKRITTFLYSRTLLHTWLKEFTNGREIVRPGATRFATSYLTLRSINEQRGPLVSLFSSKKWLSSKFASTSEGKRVQEFVLNARGFWNGVATCLKVSLPLVKVLRKVDSDEPVMGFIYHAMEQARNEIKANFNHVENRYKPVLDIIDHRWGSQLHRPLHAAAYFLNPHFQYLPDLIIDPQIKVGLYECLQRMVPDRAERVKIDMQMDDFKNAKGLFGYDTAIDTRTKKSPADWWNSYGDQCPELKRLAIRILSLTCSSSGCERNLSAFEMQKQQSYATQSDNWEDIPSDNEWITEGAGDPIPPTNEEWLNIIGKALEDEDEDTYSSRCENVTVETETRESTHGSGIGGSNEDDDVVEINDGDDDNDEINDGDDDNDGDDFIERDAEIVHESVNCDDI